MAGDCVNSYSCSGCEIWMDGFLVGKGWLVIAEREKFEQYDQVCCVKEGGLGSCLVYLPTQMTTTSAGDGEVLPYYSPYAPTALRSIARPSSSKSNRDAPLRSFFLFIPPNHKYPSGRNCRIPQSPGNYPVARNCTVVPSHRFWERIRSWEGEVLMLG